MQIKRKNVLFIAATFWAAMLVYPSFLQANSTYQTSWSNLYGGSTSDNSGCQLCHTADTSTPQWNAYGWAIREDGGSTINTKFTNVEGLDSDGDPSGSSNLEEINANVQPGWTAGANNSIYNAAGLITSTASPDTNQVLDIPTHSIGGAIAGLTGSVTLQNNGLDDLVRNVNGDFTFSTELPEGSNYAVTVSSQPVGQICTVTNGSGTVATVDITNVTVACADEEVPTYSVGGNISGLSGSVTLQNNGGNDLTRTVNGGFTFTTELIEGSAYAVTVSSQPTGQTCSVINGNGTIATVDITSVIVECVDDPYSVGGTINGLLGSVTLQNNGTDDLIRTTNGDFAFANLLDNGSAYAVTVSSQPRGQTCSVTNGSGTIARANVTDVTVTCSNVLGVAFIEWEEFPVLTVPIPFLGNSAMLIIGFACLFIGFHYIRRRQTTIARMLAIFAISSGVLISTQSSYHFIEMTRAASMVMLTTSPQPLGLGDNGIKNVQSQRISITGLIGNSCEFDQSMANLPACKVGTALQPEESCYVYVTCDPGSPKVSSPNGFLQFAIPIADPETAAEQYYQAIDPGNNKDTLAKWKAQVGFNGGYDAMTVYLNDTDLGFGRRMFIRTNPDGSVASYVENYPTIQDAADETNIIATVAMEYSDPAATGSKFTQFYTFGPNGERLLAVDLDGRGERYQPGVCNVCHGGNPKEAYPDAASADTGAGFLPWDMDTFVYATAPAELTRTAQEGEFKKLNEAVLDTNPTAAAKELIEGWYGGSGLPGVFDGEFAPDAWVVNPVDANDTPVNVDDATTLYNSVVAPYCRVCHVQRPQDFASYKNFDQYKLATQIQVFEQGTMPLALRTFEKIWHSSEGIEVLADYLGIDPEPNPHSP